MAQGFYSPGENKEVHSSSGRTVFDVIGVAAGYVTAKTRTTKATTEWPSQDWSYRATEPVRWNMATSFAMAVVRR